MKKNTRIKHRKYNSRKKYIFPLVALSMLLAVSVVGVFAAKGDPFTDANTGLIYEIVQEQVKDGDTVTTEGTVTITGYDKNADENADSALKNGMLTIPATVTYDPSADVENDEITYNIVSIGTDAFNGNTDLRKVNVSDAEHLYKIEQRAFKDCTSLDQILMAGTSDKPGTITHVFKEAFMGCSNIEKVSFPNDIQLISQSAFENCTSLWKVYIENPASLETIGSRAFYNCPWLSDFPDLKTSNASIAEDAFWGCCYLKGDVFPEKTDPFGTDLFLDAELRGTSITKIIPASEKEYTDISETQKDNIPLRFFAGQEYRVSFDPSGRTIKGLDLLEPNMKIPDTYSISDEFSNVDSNPNTYDFTIPEAWNSDTVFLFAVATANAADNGAPTITTDELPTGIKGKDYSDFQLEANTKITSWSWEAKDGSTLPSGFSLNQATGVLSYTGDAIPADAVGEYEVIITADNGISTHKKLFTLSIRSNELSAFEADSLWWEEKHGDISAAWKPLTNLGSETVMYTIQVYDEAGNKVGPTYTKELPADFTSSFASVNVTDSIKEKGTYYFTVKAENDDYGSSYASSVNFSKGKYAYGYETYTITATATGSGTGKISLSDDSYREGVEVFNNSNGIDVEVREDSVTESTPIKFIFTPSKGCEATTLMVDNSLIRKNKESYTFTSIGRTGSSDGSGSDSTGSSTGGGDTGGDSGVIGGNTSGDTGVLTRTTTTASNNNAKLNSDGNNNHTVEVEFSLVSNNIDGDIISKGTYIQKEKASFQAIGDDMDEVGEADGDTRWVPKYWYLDDEKATETTTKHSWNSDPYTDSIDTTNLSLGTHTLYVAFQKQNYVGASGWVDSTAVNSVDVQAVDFVVTDRSGNTEDPEDTGSDDEGAGTTDDKDKDKDTSEDKDKDSSSGDKSSGDSSSDGSSSGIGSAVDRVTSVLSGVDTSDDMVMGLWVALALASLLGIGFCIRQIIKFS